VPANLGSDRNKLEYVTGAYDLVYGGNEHLKSIFVAGMFFLIIGIIPLVLLLTFL